MKRGPKHLRPLQQENRKKVNVENTAKISVLDASSSGCAGCRYNLNLMSWPSPPPRFGSEKPLINEPDRHRGRPYDRVKDNFARPSRSESRGRNGRYTSRGEVDHYVGMSRVKIPKPRLYTLTNRINEEIKIIKKFNNN